MFTKAIAEAQRYTRSIHTIDRIYGKTQARAGSATLFFVNESGVAVTCKHVAQLIPYAENLNRQYAQFKEKRAAFEKNARYNDRVKALAKESGFDANALCEMFIQMQGIGAFDSVQTIMHPTYDLAIVKFINLRSSDAGYARFLKDGDSVQQGMSVCRLGFPFPEFSNFEYSEDDDTIRWTNSGNLQSPSFPIDGMVTRFLGGPQGIWGIETSTPGLRGQSGGPLFNREGVVYGMQSATNHLHLGFDMKNAEIISNGQKINVSNQPFLHVGHCVHADVIKQFLRDQGISFHQAQ